MSEKDQPNQNSGCSEQHVDYLKRAAEACAAGDTVLGMHLYLAAYEKAAADPSIPDGMALAGLREAWELACELKERSMAEYVFEKLEPYLTGEEIAICAGKLQSLALDRLEEYGFSREDLADMAEMISQDIGGEASVVKVESISIPHAGMFGVPAASAAPAGGEQVEVEAVEPDPDLDSEPEPAEELTSEPQLRVGSSDDFNPYDMYRDYSIGKSYHAATNEGSGAAVFTRDAERQQAHDEFVAGGADAVAGQGASAEAPEKPAQPERPAQPAQSAQLEQSAAAPAPARPAAAARLASGKEDGRKDIPDLPDVPKVGDDKFNYRSLVGYDSVIAVMRDVGVGLQNDRGYQNFLNMLNERHGLDRAPALDTLLLRAGAIEDAARFVEATIGELGLPALRLSMEEGAQGMPVLCVTTQGNNRPRMNHAHNRFEAPAILVIEDLDTWMMPEPPEGADGISNFVMANISRGAREAVNLIRSAVEDPDVYVLATATTDGEADPFFYDLLEPITVVDIGSPAESDRAAIWEEIARDHPSMRFLHRPDLVRCSKGMARYDIYMAARDAIEEAYKTGLMQRSFVPVSPQNIFEKLAAYQPIGSEEYEVLESLVIRDFQNDLDRLEELVEGGLD